MWKKRLTELGQSLVEGRVPMGTKFETTAVDNATLVKVDFECHKAAKMLIDSCNASPLTISLKETQTTLKVNWDKSTPS